MRFNKDAKLDTSQIDDERGRPSRGGLGGGRLPFPGGKGAMAGGGLGAIGLVLALVLGMCSGGGGGGLGIPGLELPGAESGSAKVIPENPSGQSLDLESSNLAENCQTGADANQRQDCRLVAVVNSVQAFWEDDFTRRGLDYKKATTNFFENEIDTGCGRASSAVGPFYCPADSQVYFDIGFFNELQSKFGAQGGPFAEAYVVAHEYGHHLQNLLGVSEKVQQSGERSGAESAPVRLELQADCLAGVWAANATSGDNPLIVEITEDDIRQGLDAAAAVGDDRIQERFEGQIDPHKWTHGSAAQRQKWFLEGFNSGELTNCDTFNQDI